MLDFLLSVLSNLIANLVAAYAPRSVRVVVRLLRCLPPIAYSRAFGEEALQALQDGLDDRTSPQDQAAWVARQLISELIAICSALWTRPDALYVATSIAVLVFAVLGRGIHQGEWASMPTL